MSDKTILIVEDERLIANDIKDRLKKPGYRNTHIASSAEEALGIIPSISPDLVIMDIGLKRGMDGVETAQEIRTQYDLPIIYVTSYTDPETLERAKSTDPHGYITKPFDDVELCTAVDVALYKHSFEKQLKERQWLLSTTLGSVADAVIATDSSSTITFLNPAAMKLTGWAETDAVGDELQNVFKIKHEMLDITHSASENLYGIEPSPQTNFTTLITKNQTEIPIEYTASPIRDDHGKLSGSVLTFRDITSRRQAQQTIEENEARYNAIVEHSYNLIIETSVDGIFIYVSQNHKDILGYEPDDLIGRSIFEYIHNDDKLAVINQCIAGLHNFESSGHITFRYLHKDGTWRWLESSGQPFKTASGEINAVITSRDITDRKQMEQEMLKSQKLESLGILAGGIAHDFNNLLTTIIGNVSLAKICGDPEEVQEILGDVEAASSRAKDLTDQLLTFAKGGVPVKKTYSIKNILEESTEFVLRGSNIKYEISVEEGIQNVNVDQGQINQVLNNLIINSKQAMPDGGIITIEAKNKQLDDNNNLGLRPGDYIELNVADEGVGIDVEVMHKIFDPYFTTKPDGNGLGLATTYSIIKNHDGNISVESEPNVGTTFHIYLPATDSESTENQLGSKTHIAGKGQILVMDDDVGIRTLLEKALTTLGYEVSFATNGRETIDIYIRSMEENKQFDAVILDLTVPGEIGGTDAIKELIAIDPGVKAIVSSGYSNDSVMAEYEKWGFKACVAKPYNLEQLSRVLYNVIESDT